MKVLLCVFMFQFSLFAGVYLEGVHQSAAGGKQNVKVWFDGQGMRLSGSSKSEIIFHEKTQMTYLIDHSKKVIKEISKQKVDDIKVKIAGMKALAKNMDPAQRQAMEKMMGGISLEEQPESESVKTSKQKQAGYDCQGYDEKSAGKTIGQVCAVPFKTLGVDISEFDFLMKYSEYFEELATFSPESRYAKYFTSKWMKDKGFPVWVKMNGQTYTWNKVEKKAVDSKVYDIPKGYQKSALGF